LVAFFHGLFLGIVEVAGVVFSELAPAFSMLVELGSEILTLFVTIGTSIAEAFGMATDTTMDWRSAGALVAEVLGGLIRATVLLFKVYFMPGLRIVISGVKLVSQVIGPLIKLIIYLGKVVFKSAILPFRILFALITGNIESIGPMFASIGDDLIGIFKSVINFIGNLARAITRVLFDVIMAPFEIIPKSVRPGWLNDAIAIKDEMLAPIDLFGDSPVHSYPKPVSMSKDSDGGFLGIAGRAMAARTAAQDSNAKQKSSSPEIINITRVIVDGEILEETRKRYNNQERGRYGRVSAGRRGGY